MKSAQSQSAWEKYHAVQSEDFAKSEANAKVAQLTARIEKGETNVEDAAARLDADDPRLAAARAKLDGLREERAKIEKEWVAPHIARAHLTAAIRAIKDMPFEDRAFVEFDIPGILTARVEVQSEPPF